jgi:DNA-binding response OmpR family regulator
MKKVWIVDDDEEMSRAIGLMLKLLDCETRKFYSARLSAQALIDGERPDLFVLDINMPGVTGIDFLKYLRSQPATVNIPVVMLSSEAAEVLVDKALELGADAYVTKPVTIEELEAAMNKAYLHHGLAIK